MRNASPLTKFLLYPPGQQLGSNVVTTGAVLETLTLHQLISKLPASNGAQRFITMLKKSPPLIPVPSDLITDVCQRFGGNGCPRRQGQTLEKRKLKAAKKCCCLCARLHGIMSQRAVVLIHSL